MGIKLGPYSNAISNTWLPFSFAVDMANSLRAFAKGEFASLLSKVSHIIPGFDFIASTFDTCCVDPNIAKPPHHPRKNGFVILGGSPKNSQIDPKKKPEEGVV